MATLFAIDRIMFVHSMCSIIRISNEGGRGRDRGECYKELSPLSVDHLRAARKFPREKQLFSQVVRREQKKEENNKILVCDSVFSPRSSWATSNWVAFKTYFDLSVWGLQKTNLCRLQRPSVLMSKQVPHGFSFMSSLLMISSLLAERQRLCSHGWPK